MKSQFEFNLVRWLKYQSTWFCPNKFIFSSWHTFYALRQEIRVGIFCLSFFIVFHLIYSFCEFVWIRFLSLFPVRQISRRWELGASIFFFSLFSFYSVSRIRELVPCLYIYVNMYNDAHTQLWILRKWGALRATRGRGFPSKWDLTLNANIVQDLSKVRNFVRTEREREKARGRRRKNVGRLYPCTRTQNFFSLFFSSHYCSRCYTLSRLDFFLFFSFLLLSFSYFPPFYSPSRLFSSGAWSNCNQSRIIAEMYFRYARIVLSPPPPIFFSSFSAPSISAVHAMPRHWNWMVKKRSSSSIFIVAFSRPKHREFLGEKKVDFSLATTPGNWGLILLKLDDLWSMKKKWISSVLWAEKKAWLSKSLTLRNVTFGRVKFLTISESIEPLQTTALTITFETLWAREIWRTENRSFKVFGTRPSLPRGNWTLSSRNPVKIRSLHFLASFPKFKEKKFATMRRKLRNEYTFSHLWF